MLVLFRAYINIVFAKKIQRINFGSFLHPFFNKVISRRY